MLHVNRHKSDEEMLGSLAASVMLANASQRALDKIEIAQAAEIPSNRTGG